MKILKVLGVIVLIVIILGIIAYLAFPKDINIERTASINAPAEVVFAQIVSFENQNKWSPWADMDSTMTYEIEGEDGTLNAIYRWAGDPDKTGKGEMSFTNIEENKRVDNHLKFFEPWENEADASLILNPGDDGTEVTWTFNTTIPFPGNVFMALQGGASEMNESFDHGLELLKEICEKEPMMTNPMVDGYEIMPADFAAKNFIARKQVVKWADLEEYFGTSYGMIMKAMGENGLEPAGMPCGIYYSWDEENMETDMAAAMPVGAETDLGGELTSINVQESKALLIDYWGSYENSEKAHLAMNKYIEDNGIDFKGPVIEEYVTDPGNEPDTAKWNTKIYYLVNL